MVEAAMQGANCSSGGFHFCCPVSRTDYCNSVFTALRQLQLIQNAAARVLTRIRTLDHITPLLRSLCRLPVCQGLDFKILLLVYKALNGFEPYYIHDLLLCYEASRPRRSSGTCLLSVSRVKTRPVEAAFSYYEPHIWNKLQVCSNSHLF